MDIKLRMSGFIVIMIIIIKRQKGSKRGHRNNVKSIEKTKVWHVVFWHPVLNLPLTWGSFQRAIVFPTSWIRPTNWNQSAQGQWIQILTSLVYLPNTFSVCIFVALPVNGTFVWVCLADALSSLEGMEGVGEVHVRIGLVHQLVQRQDGFYHPHLSVCAASPFRVLQEGKSGRISGEVFFKHTIIPMIIWNAFWWTFRDKDIRFACS